MLNRLAHGFVAVPLILALERRGLFAELARRGGMSVEEMVATVGARQGPLAVVLRLLVAMGWLDQDGAVFRLGGRFAAGSLPGKIEALYRSRRLDPADPAFAAWLEQSRQGWGDISAEAAILLDGAVVLPLLPALRLGGEAKLGLLSSTLRDGLFRLLTTSGNGGTWTAIDGLLSCRSLLAQSQSLLFGGGLGLSRARYEGVLRCSGFDQDVHLQGLRAAILDQLNVEPVETQPRYVLDCGCGNGDLLRSIYLDVLPLSKRNAALERHPLTLIGAVADGRALKRTAANLAGLPHILLQGDPSEPQAILAALAVQGVTDIHSILHILAFQHGVADSLAGLESFLSNWRDCLGRHGLLLAGLHAVQTAPAERSLDASEAAVFDALHGLLEGHLVEAGSFMLAAGRVGLFPRAGSSRRFPAGEFGSRVTIHHFDRRPFVIRPAQPADLDILLAIDRDCWNEAIRTPRAEVFRRIEQHGEDQFLVEMDGDVVGALYTQPVASVGMLEHAHWLDLAAIRQPAGPVLEFISLNVCPNRRAAGLGDQLLDFVLEYARCSNRIQQVAAVSRCSAFVAHRPRLAQDVYIRLRDAGDQLIDPLLNFHESHGAEIVGLVPGFRPEDADNEGCGVLVRYDLLDDVSRLRVAASSRPMEGAEILAIVERLVRVVIEEQGSAGAKPSRTQPFMEMGLESMQLLRLRALLGEHFLQPVNSSFLFRHNTIVAVAAALGAQIDDTGCVAAAAPPVSPLAILAEAAPIAAGRRDGRDEIAIIGLSCRLPGGGPDGFWRLLKDGTDGVRTIPPNRWWWPASDPAWRKFESGGYLDEIDAFDAEFFRISRAEADLIDPQQRILLELTWELFEDAGYDPETLRGSATGVWIGGCSFDYRELVAKAEILSGMSATGTSGSILPNRVSYFFDLKGPSLLIDTACSSSLVALHDAVQSLRRGECNQAVVGGINLICSPTITRSFARAGMLSPHGRCRTFDRDADGYVRGEGGGMVLLKPLSRALADGDQIYGIVAGSAVNHGGEASSLTAPSPRAQCDVITGAYVDAAMSPLDVDYVEAHGTGTKLGDPIEISALKEAFDGLIELGGHIPSRDWTCGIGSIKTNIGHLEGAAGIAGLVKVLLALRHGELPGNLHFHHLNPYIELAGSPFGIVSTNTTWQRSGIRPRAAGISSFGFGGVSAHMLVREFIDPRPAMASDRPQIIPLSARSEQQLRHAVAELLAHLEDRGDQGPSLQEIAWTLQSGRAAMAGRLGVVAESLADLRHKLRGFLADERNDQVHHITVQSARLNEPLLSGEEGRDYVRAAIRRGELGRLVRLWVSGAAIDWTELHGGQRLRRVSLPTYPFAREHFWLSPAQMQPAVKQVADAIHPMLHNNNSDFSAQRFSTTLTGDEFFLADHVLKGRRVLPGAACLEMARAAVSFAAGGGQGGGLYLRDVVWLRPVVVGGEPVELNIGLTIAADGEIPFEIFGVDGPGGNAVVYTQARAGFLTAEAPAVNIEEVRRRCGINHLGADALYQRFAQAGFQYGERLRGVVEVWWNEAEAISRLVLPSSLAAGAAEYFLHPSLMDSALQVATAAVNLLAGERDFAMPYSVDRLEILQPCTASMWVVLRRQGGGAEKLDIDLCAEDGQICVRFIGLSVRAAASALEEIRPEAVLWQRIWRDAALIAEPQRPSYDQTLVILCGVDAIAPAEIESRLTVRCLSVAEDGPLTSRYAAASQLLWAELQRLFEGRPQKPVLVQVVVPGAGELAALSGLGGFLKTARLELTRLVGQVIEIEAGETADGLAAKIGYCALAPQATQLRFTEGRCLAESWDEIATWASDVAVAHSPWREGGVYLLTGGTGGLGQIFATEIAEQSPGCTLILAARSDIDDEMRRQLQQLESLGTHVVHRRLDVTDPVQVREALRRIRAEFGALHGIIHGAGLIRDGLLVKQPTTQLHEVLAPKVAGLINLDLASRDLDLDWIVCMASTSGALGNVGQAAYAAANAFMDEYVRHRLSTQEAGRHRIVSVDWPLWEQGGMRVDPAIQRLMRRQGMEPLATADGLRAFYQALAAAEPQMMVLYGEPERLRSWMTREPVLPRGELSLSAQSSGSGVELNDALGRMIRSMLSRLLKTSAEELTDDGDLSRFGLDSISLTELTNQINQRLGIALTPTFFFEHPTMQAVVEHLAADYPDAVAKALRGSVVGSEDAAAPAAPAGGTAPWRERWSKMRPGLGATQSTPDRSVALEPIAIIGLSGRYPGAWDVGGFWGQLRGGVDCITEVPAERWDWRACLSEDRTVAGRHYSKWGGFIGGVDEFDPLFFGISPREARLLDPQERLFLEHAWMAMEDAGYTRSRLQVAEDGGVSGQVGVYVGAMYSEYQLLGAEATGRGQPTPVFASFASIANRVSYVLNLHGPSLTVDTMCSSSLTAIHVACQDLRLGRTRMAIAGGVNVSIHPHKYLMLSAGQFISSDGHCQSFGEGGDGYIPGEGVGAVLLKRLPDAQRDGDHVWGVILGSALSHGGKTNGYTVPNPQAQGSVIAQALAEARVDARHVSYVEAHGTGTKLGDPIEIAALSQAFGRHSADVGYCRIGSAKSNIGHCESAAGIAGLTKVLLQMRHGEIVPSLHSARLNPHIDFARTPFVVNQSLVDWQRPRIDGREVDRIAGLSSFGAGGSNAHMIVREYRGEASARPGVVSAGGPERAVIVLSARTPEQLRQKACDLVSWLAGEGASADLAAVAYTLQVGREAMDERLGLLAGSLAELSARLGDFLAGAEAGEAIHRGQAKRSREGMGLISQDDDMREAVDKWIARRKYTKLLELWVKGLDVDWDKLHGATRPRRVSLPSYPFARERYWIEVPPAAAPAAAAQLHPLLHVNISDLHEQSYACEFDGSEVFLADHLVSFGGGGGRRVLPAVAYLEMAREAIARALPGESVLSSGLELELRQTVWARPVVVDERREVRIALQADAEGGVGFEVYSLDADGAEQVHCQGRGVHVAAAGSARLPLGEIAAGLDGGSVAGAAFYARLHGLGLRYGPAHQAIEALRVGASGVLAQLRLPGAAARDAARYVLHPSLMDAALQACLGLAPAGGSEGLILPYAVESVRVLGGWSERMLAWVRLAPGSTAGLRKLDIDLCAEDGAIRVQMRGFSARAAEGGEDMAAAAGSGLLWAVPAWSAQAVPGACFAGPRHVLLCGLAAIVPAALGPACVRLESTAGDVAGVYAEQALAAFAQLRAVLAGPPAGPVLVQVVTDQALALGLGGLLRTAAAENPLLRGQVVLVEAGIDAASLAARLAAEDGGDVLVRWQDGRRSVQVWREQAWGEPAGGELVPAPPAPVALREDGVYLITGGLGGLGRMFAEEITRRTASGRVVLSGRGGLDAARAAQLAALAGSDRIGYRQVDLSDPGSVDALIAGVLSSHGRLDGILHGAGQTADNYLLKKSAAEMRAVLEPKVAGTVNLDLASRDVALDFLVLFASVAGALGNAGQGDYAAGNGFMDQYAQHRQHLAAQGRRHGRTLSIDWPLWAEGGMRIDAASQRQMQAATGAHPLATAPGLQAFHAALAQDWTQVLVLQGNTTRLRQGLERPAWPFETAPAPAIVAAAVGVGLEEQTQDHLRGQLSGVLQLPASRIDAQAPLETYGIDSVMAMSLTRELEKSFGPLSKTLFFEHQTLADLARYFLQAHAGALAGLFAQPAVAAPAPAAAAVPVPPGRRRAGRGRAPAATPDRSVALEPIAIIGLSGRYPGAWDVGGFWGQLRGGVDCITEVPAERWDWRACLSEDRTVAGRHYSKWGGFIGGVDEFDPLFFGISPREARLLDPQERLFLEHAWMAMEDAGYTRSRLQVAEDGGVSGQVGVYVGAMYSEYQLLGAEATGRGQPTPVFASFASIANRVSYVLNLHGPSLTVDTMCSSSLTAIHVACQDLRLGRTRMAIAGGVNVSIHPHKYLMLSAGQFISSDGHCQSFGEGGDGYIPGEGVGAVLLKRLPDAQRDGDHVWGVILGSALSHGGKTNGYTVPNPQAQGSVIAQALAEARVDARHVSYVEAHGTGTKLGDPIEIAALSQAFGRHSADVGYCRIGSAKSNIGHCESAAGIAGLTKVLLQMRHREIVPSLHSARLNPHIDFARTPFVVNQSLVDWQRPRIDGREVDRIAGLSSFGAGGSNAHMIVREYRGEASARPGVVSAGGPERAVIVLSARTPEQLRQKACDLVSWLAGEGASADLAAVAYTLQVGREAMDERLGLLAGSLAELSARLGDFLAGAEAGEAIHRGQAKRSREGMGLISQDDDMREAVDKWIARRKYTKLLELWVKGLDVDWDKLHGATRPRRVSLPSYPFARERYWIEVPPAAAPAAAAQLHPLLHVNISDLHEQSYACEFDGSEVFLAESKNGKVLPPSATLEMARVAITMALPAEAECRVELRRIVWAQPAPVEKHEVRITLQAEADGSVGYEIYTLDEAGVEQVHCQGCGGYVAPLSANVPLAEIQHRLSTVVTGDLACPGLEELRLSESEALSRLHLTQPARCDLKAYAVHPCLLDAAMLTGALLTAQALPGTEGRWDCFSVGSAMMIAPATIPLFAWARRVDTGQGFAVDVDLCDGDGNVCVALRSLAYQFEAGEAVVQNFASSAIVPVTKDREIDFSLQMSLLSPSACAPSSKPSGILLPEPRSIIAAAGHQARPQHQTRPQVMLTALSTAAVGTGAVRLFDRGHGVMAVEFAANEDNLLTPMLQSELRAALAVAASMAGAKVAVLSSCAPMFLNGGAEQHLHAVDCGLYRDIAAFPLPLIAVLRGSASGAGLLVAALCDFMVCTEEAEYCGLAGPGQAFAGSDEYHLLAERFGVPQAMMLCFSSIPRSGRVLHRQGFGFPVLAANRIDTFVAQLAASLADKTTESLRLLKRHLSRGLPVLVERLGGSPQVVDVGSASALIPVAESHMKVTLLDDGIVTLSCADKAPADVVVDALCRMLGRIVSGPACRALVLTSGSSSFLPFLEAQPALAGRLAVALAAAPVPVIAVLNRSSSDLAWFVAQSCDACVYGDDSIHSFDPAAPCWQDGDLALAAAAAFTSRLGAGLAEELSLAGAIMSGSELLRRHGALTLAGADEALAAAARLAAQWVAIPLDVRMAWRRELQAVIGSADAAPADQMRVIPGPVDVQSQVVAAHALANGVLVVTMEDHRARNMFSPELSAGLNRVFAHVATVPGYKAVVLAGYGDYFASGGTRANLVAIQQGEVKFTDDRIFDLPLHCPVPVIAAMQGHAIGAGWALGMFADFAILSAEARYLSPYMDFGFTPGAGATLVFPERIGLDLARETLLTARAYSGAELRRRGVSLPVLTREEVVPAAMELACRLARLPLSRLIALKAQFTVRMRDTIKDTYRRELEMHAQTFVGRADTLRRIQDRFASTTDGAGVDSVAVVAAIQSPPVPATHARIADLAAVRALLAAELQMNEAEIDEDTQFVDLGLDSIGGVTFIRKINERFGTVIEATQIYSHATLRRLTFFIGSKMGGLAPLPIVALAVASALQVAATMPTQTLSAQVRSLLASELQMSESEFGEDTQFVDLGLDSISGVTFVRKINARFGTTIEATQIYSHPTLRRLAGHIAEEMSRLGIAAAAAPPMSVVQPAPPMSVVQPAPPTAIAQPAAPVAPARVALPQVSAGLRRPAALRSRRGAGRRGLGAGASPEPVAVIGMVGQFPQAGTLEAFWRNIAAGRDCIGEVPRDRWDVDAYYQPGQPAPGKTNSRWLGALEDYDRFDPLFFAISPAEAESMDPQQRLFLQACWNVIEHAGYDAGSLAGSKCGVFVGCATSDYHLASASSRLSAQGFTGAASSILAARISYFLDLQGPSLAIDTACSSSLVAIAQACDSLQSGASSMALAGGVYVMAGPEMHIKTAQAGMLSTDGRCFTFDQRANGFVPGEAVAVVMLKRLSDAERDGDSIYGVIRGWGVNQDGKTNGITAPNPQAQTRLQREVYERFGIDPRQIRLIEAHGTGTKLGDPIEVQALRAAFGESARPDSCALGSVKSNIGHCLTAAGIAGFLKLVLALHHRQLPPTIHFERLNEHISLSGSPFYVNDRLRPWPADAPPGSRLAAINAFGFSGTNAHVVVGDYAQVGLPAPAGLREAGRTIVPLSAKTAEQLHQRAADLLAILQHAPAPEFAELAYTLQTGRQPMEERAAFMANSNTELTSMLEAFLDGKAADGCFLGQVRASRDQMNLITQDADVKETLIATYVGSGKLTKLAQLWCKALDFDWNRLYRERRPRRTGLPAYPFAREPYWIAAACDPAIRSLGLDASAILHPLVHANVSGLDEQRYRSCFSGEEPFLTDHRIRLSDQSAQKVLPGMAYLEMARAAVADAAKGRIGQLELSDVVWLRPVVADAAVELFICLSISIEGQDGIDFRIVSEAGGREVVHCRGRAGFRPHVWTSRIDVNALLSLAGGAQREAEEIYAIFNSMGLFYGPAHRGIVWLQPGASQSAAELRLPSFVAQDLQDYVLHPTMLDSALQALIGLTTDPRHLPVQPLVPFALDRLRVLSSCRDRMFALVRHSAGCPAAGGVTRVDIDMCDQDGVICVQMRGIACRVISNDGLMNEAIGEDIEFNNDFYERLIERVTRREMSVDAAVRLGLRGLLADG